MRFDRTIELLVDGGKQFEVVVSFVERDGQPDELRVTIRRDAFGPPEGEAIWSVMEKDGNATFQLTTQTLAGGICLAGCFAGMLSGPLAECLQRTRTRRAVRECIRRHAVWQAIGSLSCVYGCLQV